MSNGFEIVAGMGMLVAGGLGTLIVWLLTDIRDTLKGQAHDVHDIDKRVTALEVGVHAI